MWEQIAANRRRSLVLMAGMFLLLAAIGWAAATLAAGTRSGWMGVPVAVAVFGIQMLVVRFGAESLFLAGMGAREVGRDEMPQLFNVVEEMKIASGLAHMPTIYVVEDPSPNAFAMGRKPEVSSVAVTTGLLERLNRDELQGVIAHEVAHVVNHDVSFMTLAGVVLGSVVMIADFATSMMHFGGMRGDRRRESRGDSDSGGGAATILLYVLAFAIMLVAPLLAQMLYFATSRKREFLADACATQYTRYPAGLASALEKISGGAGMAQASRVTQAMCIVNPMYAAGDGSESWFSSHPPTGTRVAVLRAMAGAGSADLATYQQAYSQTIAARSGGAPPLPGMSMSPGDPGFLISAATLAAAPALPARQASVDEAPVLDRRVHQEEIRAREGYHTIACPCGATLRVPPTYAKPSITCLRCGTVHATGAA